MNMVRMVDQLGIDVSTPGNWEWAYTPYRYMQFFGVHDKKKKGTNLDIIADADFDVNAPKAVKYKKDSPYAEDNIGDVPTFGTPFRKVKYVESYNEDGTPNMATGYNRWGMVAANTYRNGTWRLDHGVVEKGTGMNMTPPYRIIKKRGVKIGFIGCTTNRGPQVVSSTITTGVTFSGNWNNSSSSTFFGTPGDVPYRWAGTASSETAHARYQPNLPVAGFYPVYAWTRPGSDRVSNQLYRIRHTGGITEVTVNHRRVGNGWVYLGNYYFAAGTSGYVDISNRSGDSGVVIADAIRFGNGMGDVNAGGGVSGKPREDEAGLYWIQSQFGQGTNTAGISSTA